VHCPTCGYLLSGVHLAVCPECGGAFDPRDPRSYDRTPRARHRRRISRATGWGLLGIAGLATVLVVGGYILHRRFDAPLGNDAQTRTSLVATFPVGLPEAEALRRIQKLRARRAPGPVPPGVVRFSIPAGFLNEVEAELHFDVSGTNLQLRSVYTG
jgi:hypothetical protein